MDTLRILQVLAPGQFGGLESVVEQLASGLAGRGHRVSVAAVIGAGAEEPPMLPRLRAEGVVVHALEMPHRAYRKEREAVRHLITGTGFDVVHTHGYRPDVLLRGLIQGAGVPAVTTAHGFTGGGAKNRFFEWLQVRAFTGFDAVVAVSRPLAAALVAAGVPAARVHVIPNAWAPGRRFLAREEARAALDLPPSGPLVGWIGRFTREKGADLAIQAMTGLSADVGLVLVGAGRDEPALRALAHRLGLGARVHWAGFRTEASLCLRAFDVVVLSSRTEGTPIILLEAMAAGVPVVASRVGGIPDVVTDEEALLVPPERSDQLGAGIDRVLSDRNTAAVRAARAAERLRTDFATGPWLDRHESLYRSLA